MKTARWISVTAAAFALGSGGFVHALHLARRNATGRDGSTVYLGLRFGRPCGPRRITPDETRGGRAAGGAP